MALGLSVASDIAAAALDFYVRSPAFAQTIQERPLLRILDRYKKTFPGGKGLVSLPIQVNFMDSVAGFFAGYTEDDELAFKQAANVLRAEYSWKEVHAGLIITWTELKKDGVHITPDGTTRESSDAELTQLLSILQNRLEDFAESWARKMNNMLWRDGTQDAKQTPGVLSILTDTPAVGTTGGVSRVTYSAWRHRTLIGGSAMLPSPTNQTMTSTLRTEMVQLSRYGGRPKFGLCGSGFLDALRQEVHAKGYYTQTGFAGKQDISMGAVMLDDVTFEYDPTLDDLGYPKRCYLIDPKHLCLYPMDGEENKMVNPERPHNYAVFLKSMFWTGALTANMLNCHGVYEVT